MRTPLSWLRDFAPIHGEVTELTDALDDLGLVVESVEEVGVGLEPVVVARVEGIAPIEGLDRVRLVTVDTGQGHLEVACGAWNFAVGDLVPLAPVGTVLPNGMEIGARKLRGVVSNGMLCSGQELKLSEDHAGLLVLTEVEGARPGLPLTEALGIERDVVFDITVEGNRPDAWSMAGVARDLAARLRLPYALPQPAEPAAGGPPVAELASLVIEDLDLCPRMVVRVLTEVGVGPSPRWMARRLTLAGMRPINNVVDASNYVMLELGQPTHPYDLDRLDGRGLRVRRARPGEQLETLDGVTRTLGTPGRGIGDSGQDCLICDARGVPVGVAGVMGGASSEITSGTRRVLLEVAYFRPLAVARTSKKLGLRTEASARFERGCDPWAIDRAAARFVELLGAAAVPSPRALDVRGEVPEPGRLAVPLTRVQAVLGVDLGGDTIAELLEPIGFGCQPDGPTVTVTTPTNRPDIRPEPFGVDDVVEEIARMYGYARLPRRQPSWPQPGGLTFHQRQRRRVRDLLCGVGAQEAWTASLVPPGEHRRIGLAGEEVILTNPLTAEESVLRRSLLPGLLRALAYNTDRRQGELRLFEVGVGFSHPADGGGRTDPRGAELPGERELLSAVLAQPGDDARTAVAVWEVLAGALRLEPVALEQPTLVGGAGHPAGAGLHPSRSGRLVAGDVHLGEVGEVDPDVLAEFGLAGRRVGWLSVDLGLLLDPAMVPRRPEGLRLPSRFPSSDIDLAFVVDETVPAARVAEVLSKAGGELLESVRLFDVYRGLEADRRSLAFRLRFVAEDRTLTDEEVGVRRQACIDAVSSELAASLR